jgi:glyoxylase I family protein
MLYQTYVPGPPLRDLVEYLWTFSDAPPHQREVIVPSGTLELVINLRDDEIRIYRTRSAVSDTRQLGFKLDQQHLPAFAQVSIGHLTLILSGPGASGSRPMPDGTSQEPGGWNRIVLQVADLPARIEILKQAGLHFRNTLEVGPGGKQIQLADPDGNPIELFEPAPAR